MTEIRTKDWMMTQLDLPPDHLTVQASACWTLLGREDITTFADLERDLFIFGLDLDCLVTVIRLIYVARYWLGYDAETVLAAIDPLHFREDAA